MPSDTLLSQSASNSFTRITHFNGTSGKTTRGNSFLMPDTGDERIGYRVTGLTLKKDVTQSFQAGDQLQLWVFQWEPNDGLDMTDWSLGNGLDPSSGNLDPIDGTGMTALLVDTFPIEGLSFTDETYFTLDFSSTPLLLAENKSYGFLIGFEDGAGVGTSYFQLKQGTTDGHAPGIQIRTQGIPSGNGVAPDSWDVTFFVHGIILDSSVDDDQDGLSDAWEILNFQNLDQTGLGNPDGDGVDNEAEETAGTNPNLSDSDEDGLPDEVEIAGPTDPLDPDSDDDSLLDGIETGTGVFLSPLNTGTNAMLADSDGDGTPDSVEIRLGSNPNDPGNTPPERPNIVFIMVDDLDIREVGVYGQATLKTPRVDAMANQGLLFTDYYTASPVCQSSRSCLLTGQDARRSQDKHNAGLGDGYQVPLHPSRVTIAEVLKEVGYTTGCVGKWGVGGPTSGGAPWDQGFDFFCGYLGQVQAHRFFPKHLWKNGQKIYFDQTLANNEGGSLYLPGASNANASTHAWTDSFGNVCSHDVAVSEGLQFIEDNADKPFFLYCAWTPPHAFNYAAATVEALTDADGLLYDPLDLDQTLINSLYPGAPFGGTVAEPEFDPHTYASMVSAVDRDTGRIIDKLVELGIDEKTLVIFCSDNGGEGIDFLTPEHLKPGYSIFRGDKKDTYEGGIRVPFIAYWPGTIQPGTTTSIVGTFADLLPTFASMARASTPSQVTGRSILPALLGGSEDDLAPRNYHYWYFTETSNGLNRRWRAVRQGDWKIVRDRVNDSSPPTYELFNLASDPNETSDLSSSETEIISRLIPLVEGTHEATTSSYFKADDEFFTRTNLTVAAHAMGEANGSGTENGYTLTPSGTGSAFNYLPFETGLDEAATFTWSVKSTSAGAASFLLGTVNDAAQSLAIRIDPTTLNLQIANGGTVASSDTLSAEDITNGQFRFALDLDSSTGKGEVRVGATELAFDLGLDLSPLKFWGYQIETGAAQVSRPQWQIGNAEFSMIDTGSSEGAFEFTFLLPLTPDGTSTAQYSPDLQNWFDNPPGLIETHSASSQGQLQGSWLLPKNSLLPRNNDRLFFRMKRAD